MLNDYQIKERQQRDQSYYNNLKKEEHITKVFIQWCKDNGYRYIVRPTDHPRNLLGEDVYIKKGDFTASIDLKGFRAGYEHAPLSYERYENGYWHKLFNNHKITTHYCFINIDDPTEIYFIPYKEVLLHFDDYEKTEVSSATAGHPQKIIKIPIDTLHLMLV